MDERAVEIIAEHEFKTNEKLIKEFESLKPKPYRGLLSLSGFIAVLISYQYFTDSSLFDNGGFFFFMAVAIASGAVEAESSKINKRIDVLVKLIRSGSIKPDNS
jgi:hypothetical protein